MSQTGLKTGDLDLDLQGQGHQFDLQGQIVLETKKNCVTPCEYNNF